MGKNPKKMLKIFWKKLNVVHGALRSLGGKIETFRFEIVIYILNEGLKRKNWQIFVVFFWFNINKRAFYHQ